MTADQWHREFDQRAEDARRNGLWLWEAYPQWCAAYLAALQSLRVAGESL